MLARYIFVVFTILFLSGCTAGDTKENSRVAVSVGEISVLSEVKAVVLITSVESKITDVNQVKDDLEIQGDITFSLSKMGDNGMMLSVQNSLNMIIKYDIEMIDYQGVRHYTSSCPVMPGGGVFESWGHTIPELKISNFRILNESETVLCQ